MQPPTRPLLRDLLRVIAIGQSQEHEKLRISPWRWKCMLTAVS